ncbi:hypothetical protein NIES4074_49000 [Cylindrospermum sp. NIES-4074]|nr:hypothetical protein NIES4074_49000 [Cylindrospermum sp. NIES-4074]
MAINGTNGNDILIGTNGKDTLNGLGGNDIIFGLGGKDKINGGSGNDILNGGTGDDTLNGGSGNDILNGDTGNDTLLGSSGNDTLNGGIGTDTADYRNLSTSITLLTQGELKKGGGLGTDKLVGIETIIANANVANNTIDASAAVSGSINVNLQTKSLIVNGVPGVGPFTVVNFDDVKGTNQSDSIFGDSQNNQLFGNGGNDLFGGSSGNDTINGGVGTDAVDYSQLNTSITLLTQGELKKGGGLGTDKLVGIETIIANANVANNTIDAFSAVGATINVNLQTQSLIVSGVTGVGPFTVVNFDDVKGTDQSDTIIGDSQNNQLFGNAGNDTLVGGFGKDRLSGGAGADRFVFNSLSEGGDLITDFTRAEGDKIQVSKVGFGASNFNQFSYNNGALFFQGIQFATLANNPAGFAVSLDVVLV